MHTYIYYLHSIYTFVLIIDDLHCIYWYVYIFDVVLIYIDTCAEFLKHKKHELQCKKGIYLLKDSTLWIIKDNRIICIYYMH